MKLYLGEVFDGLKTRTKNADKKTWLEQHKGLPLFYTLWLAYSDRVKWLLPEGEPPFTPWEEGRNGKNRPGSEPTNLLAELRRMYLLLEGTGERVSQLKRELQFRDYLSMFPKCDRELLIAIKNKEVAKKYKLTPKLLEEIFPGLLAAPFKNEFQQP